MSESAARYIKPKSATNFFNTAVARLTTMGISVYGSRVLYVRGRASGEWRTTPVNPLTLRDGTRYLVAPRGTTQWVRNVRAAGVVEMGPRWHRRRLRATEVADSAKPELLRQYLDRWYWEVKGHIAGLTPDCGDGQFRAAAPSIPVFALGDSG